MGKSLGSGQMKRLVRELGAGGEVEGVLERLGMPVGLARRVLLGGAARRYIADMELLRELQRGLIMQRLGPQAATILAGEMENAGKPELRLRGAIAVLQMAGRRGAGGAVRMPERKRRRMSEAAIRAGLAERAERAEMTNDE